MEKKQLCGGVLADKREGVSSTEIVSQLRHALKYKRIGHTGILDRVASGLMLLLVGKATVFSRFFLHADKEYIANFEFGISTDTHDKEGSILAEWDKNKVEAFLTKERQRIEGLVLSWLKLKEQCPPLYSALKKNGKRMSDYARQGIILETKARPIQIYKSEILDYNIEKRTIRVFLNVSGGTYVRAIARDLGEELGIPVYLKNLRRVAIAGHRLNEDAWEASQASPSIEKIQNFLPNWPCVRLSSQEDEVKVSHGALLPLPSLLGEIPQKVHQDFFLENQKGEAIAWAKRTTGAYRYAKVLI